MHKSKKNSYHLHLMAVAFIVLFINSVMITCAGADDSPRKNHNLHMSQVRGFKCKIPQKRAFKAYELLDLSPSDSIQPVPSCTVLHRCDQSGCCFSTDQICLPVVEEPVDLIFMLVDTLNKKKTYRSVIATNHTDCTCGHDRTLQSYNVPRVTQIP